MSGTDTGPSVLNRLVSDGELSEVVSDHLRLDFHLVESLSVVNTNDGSDHFRDDDHVAEMSLDDLRFLIWRRLLLCLAQFLHQSHWLALQTVGETPASTAVEQFHQLLTRKKNIQTNFINLQRQGEVRLCRIVMLRGTRLFHFNSLGHVQELVQVDTSEGELPEGPLLLLSFINL